MNNTLPFVSVIIPAFNEEKHIGRCLDSLKQQDYPSPCFEIIVVDNGSSDNTVGIAKEKGVEVLILPLGKVGAVRNLGAKNAKGSVLAFIDADCLAGREWIASAVSSLNNPKVGAVGGFCKLPSQPVWVERAWVLGERKGDSKTKALAGGSFIVRRDIFEVLKGFDENINAGEDSLLSSQICGMGYDLLFLESCSVIHLGYPKRLFDFAKRQFWHSSSYSRSNLGLKDKTFVAVLMFSILCVMAFIFVAFAKTKIALILMILALMISFIFTAKRIFFGGYTRIFVRSLVSAVFVDIVYFFSRSLGLVSSFFSEFWRKLGG